MCKNGNRTRSAFSQNNVSFPVPTWSCLKLSVLCPQSNMLKNMVFWGSHKDRLFFELWEDRCMGRRAGTGWEDGAQP